jgi:hypothetical protein
MSLAILFESFSAAPFIGRRFRASPASRTYKDPAPATKYIGIDAFNGKTVTRQIRQTLSRYTVKCPIVNHIIRGNVWKNARLEP